MSCGYSTWRQLILSEMEDHKESFNDVVFCTLNTDELDKEFDSDYGLVEGKNFTLWTKKRVYFPGLYDGSEWCASVSRLIDKKPTKHIGGG